MRVSVFFGGAAVGGPAGVADAIGAFERRLGNNFLELAQLARGSTNFELAGFGDDGNTCGVVAAIFKLAKTLNNNGHNFLGADVADYSAHARCLLDEFLAA